MGEGAGLWSAFFGWQAPTPLFPLFQGGFPPPGCGLPNPPSWHRIHPCRDHRALPSWRDWWRWLPRTSCPLCWMCCRVCLVVGKSPVRAACSISSVRWCSSGGTADPNSNLTLPITLALALLTITLTSPYPLMLTLTQTLLLRALVESYGPYIADEVW